MFSIQSIRTRLIVILAGVLAVGLPSALVAASKEEPAKASPQDIDLFGDNLVAKGKDVAVKRSDLDDAMVNIKSAAAARGQTIPPQDLTYIEQQMLDRLVQVQLLLSKATDVDKASGKDLTDKRLASIKERSKDEETLNRQLKAMGTSQEKLKAKMTEEATAQNVLERELKVTVADDAVKKYYEDNPAKFEQPEMVRASHILFATKDLKTGQDLSEDKKAAKLKQAEGVLKRARTGEDFAKLVKEFSDDPGAKENNGEYTFARASADPQHAMVPEFEKAAFALKPGEVSDLVTTQYGYHIIKLSEKIPAKKLELAKVSLDIKEYLKQEQLKSRQQDYQAYMDKLKKDAGVTIQDEKLKLQPPPQPTGPASARPATK